MTIPVSAPIPLSANHADTISVIVVGDLEYCIFLASSTDVRLENFRHALCMFTAPGVLFTEKLQAKDRDGQDSRGDRQFIP